MIVTIQSTPNIWPTPLNCDCLAAPQLYPTWGYKLEIGLRAIASLCESAYAKADVVLLNSHS